MHFAKLAHEGQTRFNDTELYFNHCFRVYRTLQSLFDGIYDKGEDIWLEYTEEDIFCAALLHDVVEDTNVDLEEINKEFGNNVRVLVSWLTNEDNKTLSREERIKAREKKYSEMPIAAKLIKLADRIDNISTCSIKGDDFRDMYVRETIGLMYYTCTKNIELIDILYCRLKKKCEDIVGSLTFRDMTLDWHKTNVHD